MLKRFLLIFFILSTVFISSYPMERDKTSGHLSWDHGSHTIDGLRLEKTPPPSTSNPTSDSNFELLLNMLKLDLKQLEIKPTSILKQAIAQELHPLLGFLRIQFRVKNELNHIINFLSESIVNAHITGMGYADKLYTPQEFIYTCIYFKRALIEIYKAESIYQKYFGDPQKAVRNLLEIFTGACIIAIKINSDKEVDIYDCLPFRDPSILFTKRELSFLEMSPILVNEEMLKRCTNPILKRIERNFLKLINFKLQIDLENEFLPLVNRILYTTTNFKPEDSEKTSHTYLPNTDLAYGELAQKDPLSDPDNWSQISRHSDDESAETDMSESEISTDDEFENDDKFVAQRILQHAWAT